MLEEAKIINERWQNKISRLYNSINSILIIWDKYIIMEHDKEQDRRIDKVELHIETTNREMGEVQRDLAKV